MDESLAISMMYVSNNNGFSLANIYNADRVDCTP